MRRQRVPGQGAYAGVVAGNQRSIGSNTVPGNRDNRRHPAAVSVIVDAGRSRSIGSGIAIDEHHILTAAHVVSDARGRVLPYYSSDGRVSHWSSVEVRDDENDVAILHTEHRNDSYVPLADEEPVEMQAESHGWFSGRREAIIEQQDRTAIFGAPSRNGDSGGGIIAQYRGPVVTLGVISGTDGRRTFGAPFRAIKKLFAKCRCREREDRRPPQGPPTPPVVVVPSPADITATAESVPTTEPAAARWIPAERRLHFEIPRGRDGKDGIDGRPGSNADTESLRKEIAELRKRLDNVTFEREFEVVPK